MGFPSSAVDPEIGPQSAESGHPRAGAISILTQAGKAPPNRIRHLHHPPGRKKKRHTISFSKFAIKHQNILQL